MKKCNFPFFFFFVVVFVGCVVIVIRNTLSKVEGNYRQTIDSRLFTIDSINNGFDCAHHYFSSNFVLPKSMIHGLKCFLQRWIKVLPFTSPLALIDDICPFGDLTYFNLALPCVYF